MNTFGEIMIKRYTYILSRQVSMHLWELDKVENNLLRTEATPPCLQQILLKNENGGFVTALIIVLLIVS